VTNYASPIVLEVSILVLIESAAVWRFCWALEHFHFYSEQDRAAKCGFTSTPASELAGDPGLEEKPRWARLLCKHQK
jgi:hypothetical protein